MKIYEKLHLMIKSKTFEITIFAMIEKVIEIVVSFSTGIIVVRLLGIDDYGVISTIAGYATVINIINIAPVNYLYKEFNGSLKNKRDEAIASFVLFEKFKAVLIILIYIAVGIYLSVEKNTIGFLIVGFSNGIALSIELFTNIDRSILELNFLQKKITRTIFYSKLLKLGVTSLLFMYPSLYIIFIRDVGVAVFEKLSLRKKKLNIVHKTKITYKMMFTYIKEAFKGYCVASHFSGVLTNLIYGSDTMFLSMFCNTSVVGVYGITLTCLNYFNPFFQVVQKNTMIELGASNEYKKDISIVKKYSKLSVLLSIVSFSGYLIFGKLFFYIFSGSPHTAVTTYQYGIFIFGGVCIYNCVRPLTSYLCLRGNINKYVVVTLLPSTIFSVMMYYISAKFFGVTAVAITNVIAYSFWSVLVLIYLFTNKKRIRAEYKDN